MIRVVVAALAAAALSLSAWGQTPEELRALLDRGQAEAAYQLGRRAPERLGDPAFDMYFGIAAINSGRAGEGVLALERFMLVNPAHEGARVELARGYFLLGDDARAREEFEAAAAKNPPPEIARVVREHLDALRERESRYKPTAVAYLEGGGGYDSNPRAGVDNPVISLPVLGDVTVADSGVRVADRTLQYGGGFRLSAPLFPRVAAFAAGQAEVVRYQDEKDFDQTLYAGSAGLMGRAGRGTWRAGASLGYQTLNHAPYRRVHGVFVDGTVPIASRDALSLGLQVGKLDYQGANNVRDSDFTAMALGWRHALGWAWKPTVDFTVNAGRERNDFDDRQDLSRDMHGMRVGFAMSPIPNWTLMAGGIWQRSRYREPDALLLTTRDDRYVSADLLLAWNATRLLTLRLELSAASNDSSIALYEYTRRTAIAKARYEFR